MPHGPVRATAPVGFFGKLPSRGNFIRAGLLRALISAWGGWRWSRSKAASLLDKSVASLAPGDRLLACSDGLTKALPAPEFRVLTAADDAAGALVAAAVDRGSPTTSPLSSWASGEPRAGRLATTAFERCRRSRGDKDPTEA